MTRAKWIAAMLGALVIGRGAMGQPAPDPYGGEYSRHLAANYEQQRADTIDALRMVYFAVGCRVIISGGEYPLVSNLMAQNQRNAAKAAVIDKHSGAVMEAMNEGLRRAKSDGCSYWHDHPESVFTMRQTAQRGY